MATVEVPPGQAVIELLGGAARPADQLGALADVLDVAGLAVLTLVLLAVKAPAGGELAAEILVAVEAQARDDLLARLVALAAVVVPVDVRVGLRERAGGQELRVGGARHDTDEDDQRKGKDDPGHAKIQR